MCGDYCGYNNSRHSAMVLCFLEFIVVTATVDIVQWYCVLCIVYCVERNSSYRAMILCCVGDYCGYINSRFSGMVMCCLWRLLWLQQQ